MKFVKKLAFSGAIIAASTAVAATQTKVDIDTLLARTKKLEQELKKVKAEQARHQKIVTKKKKSKVQPKYISMPLSVHTLETEPELLSFHPSALMAGDYILTYIAGVPVVTSPYLGERPAFDGSDLIVNISSINQDVRLMMQRNAISRALKKLGYPDPNSPIIALSGAIEPYSMTNKPYTGKRSWDIDLGTAELDIATALNSWVEGYFSFSYDNSPPAISGRRMNNSTVRLGKGFVNIGNLDRTPFYFTAGQLYVPFGRYSSSMISAPLPLLMSRTIARPIILGFRHQHGPGLYGALYAFKSDTTLNSRAVGGVNLGYDFEFNDARGEIGISYISGVNDASGMQGTGNPAGQFGGFGATTATEAVKKIPAIDLHANINVDAFNFAAEWVGVSQSFRTADLSYNTRGAKPQALNIEGAYTFKVANKPASVGVGYGWSDQGVALGLPKYRIAGVFNVSIWRDTVESIEFRHDVDYGTSSQGAGIGSTAATRGTGRHSNTLTAQLGIYF